MPKKITFLIIFICLIGSFLAFTALAATDIGSLLDETAGAQGAGYNLIDKETGLATVVGMVTKVFLSILGVLFVSYTVYGGYTWLTAAGNEEKVKKAKDTITQGIIGLIIVLSAWAIYNFVYVSLTSGV